jgi:hypothetical protein
MARVFSGGHVSGMKLLDGFEGAALRGCDHLKGILFKCFFRLYIAFGFSISHKIVGIEELCLIEQPLVGCLENDRFRDTKIHKVLNIPFYRHLKALCLQKDFFETHQIASKKERFTRQIFYI